MTSSPGDQEYFSEEEIQQAPIKREVDLTNLTPGEQAINECLLKAGKEGLSASELLDQVGEIGVDDITNSGQKGIWASRDYITMIHYSFIQ